MEYKASNPFFKFILPYVTALFYLVALSGAILTFLGIQFNTKVLPTNYVISPRTANQCVIIWWSSQAVGYFVIDVILTWYMSADALRRA